MESIEENKKIKEILEKVKAGTATYEDADEYAVEVGEALSGAFRKHISSDVLPDGKMYYNIASRLIPEPCRMAHAAMTNVSTRVQRALNENAKVNIEPQVAPYNEDREKGLIEYMCRAEQYDDVSKSVEGDLVNFVQSMVTDNLKANAEFQYLAGLSPTIHRKPNPGCCDWCGKLAGTYPYEEVKETGSDVYRRHRDCRCKVTYDPGDGSRQDVHTKRWVDNDGQILQESVDRKAGAINKGAYNDINDPYHRERDRIADELYEQIRNREREYEIAAVAKNSGFSVEEVDAIFAHLFEREHLFADGSRRRFDADYYMAHSWLRLREGKNIKRHDIMMLRHELAEVREMEKTLEITYEEAHNKVEQEFSYREALMEYLKLHDV